MNIRLKKFKDKKHAYSFLKIGLKELDYEIEDPKEISYGIQFIVSKDEVEGLVRIYESKKGVNLDLSQIKNKIIERDILLALGLKSEEKDTAETKETASKVYSLCIGINEFEDKNIGDLKYAKADALKLGDLLDKKFKESDSRIKIVDKEATKGKIIEALEEIKNNAKEEDIAIVLIATHGEFIFLDKDLGYYIICYDTDSKDLQKTSLSMDLIRKIVSEIRAEKKVIFIDTCYSGGMSRRDIERISKGMKEKVFQQFDSGNFIIMTASQANQKSYECDKLKQGVFTYYLIKGLTGAVEHKDEEIDLHTLYYYIYSSVKKYVAENFKGVQQPKFFGSFTGPFTLPLLKKLSEIKTDSVKVSFQTINCIGIDESGKGDFFGPLVVAGVYVDTEEKIDKLKKIGVQDSKKITDNKIIILAKKIKEICDSEVIFINPVRYNELWKDMGNLNDVLAWCHAQSLERLLQRNPKCDIAISDQFAGKEVLLDKLKEKGKAIELLQRPKAEENIAVAAASILAREKFLESLQILEKNFGQKFPKGANDLVINEAIKFLKKGGKLNDVAKIHFKTMDKINEIYQTEKKGFEAKI